MTAVVGLTAVEDVVDVVPVLRERQDLIGLTWVKCSGGGDATLLEFLGSYNREQIAQTGQSKLSFERDLDLSEKGLLSRLVQVAVLNPKLNRWSAVGSKFFT